MLLSPSQIRAARALINWSQEDLANATGLARPTIVNIEAGHHHPNSSTIQKFLDVFDRENVIFTSQDGVRKKKNYVQVFRGHEQGFHFFTNIILEYVRQTHGFVYSSNVDPDYFKKCLPGFYESDFVNGMRALAGKIDVRVMSCEGDYRRPVKSYATYRWLPKETFNAITPFYVFGDHLAIILFLDEITIFLIKDEKCAQVYKEKFLIQWESAVTVE